jgi:hypothetical protein
MKRLLHIVTLVACAGVPAVAGVHFGLGDAVAKRSAELINKAGHSMPVTGDSVAATLANCPGGAIFDTLPIDMTLVGGIDPLGHVQPTGHTFPSDHIYYYASAGAAMMPTVYAPGHIHITNIGTSTNLSVIPNYTDYTITFYACQEFRVVLGHVKTVSASILSRAGAMNNCNTYSTGGSTFQACNAETDIELQSGDIIGSIALHSALDFGASDSRVTLNYVSPQRRGPNQLHTVCAVDYYTAGPRATMQAKLGRFDGGFQRVNPPACGTIEQDVANRAKGYWYHPGSPDNPEDPHLSLIDNNVYAPQQTISVGNSLPNGGGLWYIFNPISGAGQHNREFSEVSADTNIYCYDTFLDPLDQPIGIAGPKFILQMLTPTTLRFEKQGTGNCGGGPWTFTANAVTFQR